MATYEIDGSRFSSFQGFLEEFSREVTPGWWSPGDEPNLDAFNDALHGGYGTPDEGFALRWKHHGLSKERLGYAETVRHLERRLERCHPSNIDFVKRDLELARAKQGPTASSGC